MELKPKIPILLSRIDPCTLKPQAARGRWVVALSGSLTLASFLTVTLLAQDQPKKYDLKLDWKPVEGYQTEVSSDDAETSSVSISAEGQTLTEELRNEATTLLYTEVAIRVKEDKATESRLSFSKATRRRDDRETTLGFEGKTVVVKVDAEGRHTFTYEDGEAIAPEDLEVLSKLPDYSDKKPGEPSGEEIFAPKTPVALGESWTPDIELMAQAFGGGAVAIDPGQSSATATLKSVTTRDGVDFGQIELSMDLYLTKFGPMQLDKPVLMKMSAHIDACIDGQQPDGAMTMTGESEGETEASVEGTPRKLHLSLDMKTKDLVRKKTLM
jgi:hypothetical protein